MAAMLPLLKRVVPVITAPPFPENALVVTVDNQVVAIDAEALTPREVALVKALLPQAQSQHPWARFLRGEGLAPTTHPVRMLYFNVDLHNSQATPGAWLDALCSLFASAVTGFFDTASSGVVIEPTENFIASTADLAGILDTLDSDFDSKTRLFIGHPWPVDDELPGLVAAERQLAAAAPQRLATIQQTALATLTRNARQNNPLLQALTAVIAQDAGMQDVITTLYHEQGNLTAAAKALFLHRNTLQYRLEKFEHQTGFNLRQMDDLVLCALLIQA
ncbi:helix-turn-helix domain-containing protein [Lacticaseibacillus parakribbianus]|uniref:helix-turn-helix domain-containing protein n=1 Tax=Lacticaseibacillus parakribbianus TaxID=2970927 RepID=UPI0021CB531B|nr:helix-turn-helix domain-containing protein [Lacticaseibacillus parakribbianus]